MGGSKFAFDRSGSTVRLEPGEVTIGSGADCVIRIEGETVEALQAVVLVDETQAVLESRGREQDIRINGMPSRVADLKSGDRLRFGDVELTLESSPDGQSLSGAAGSFAITAGDNLIGRSPEGAVVLNDNSVSREHARVVVLPGLRVLVRDLLSSNGTFVNDQRLGELALSTGDIVEVGTEKLLFVEVKVPRVAGAEPLSTGGPLDFKLLVGTELQPLQPGIVTIGRSPDCDISLNDGEASGRHAELAVGAREVRLRDLGSSNGTRVNERPISTEVTLSDRDTVTIGKTRIVFMAPSAGGDLDKTVLSGSAPDLGKTVVSSAAGAPPPTSASAPPAGSSGLALLELSPGASQAEIQRKFQEFYSDFQIRLTNAPTADLKNKYQQKLDELQAVRDQLLAPEAGDQMDLPSAEPVHGGDAGGASSDAESAPPIEILDIPKAPQRAPKGAAEKKERKPTKSKKEKPPKSGAAKEAGGLPRSALIMAGISAFTVLLVVVLAFFGRKAIAVSDGVLAELGAKEAAITAMSDRIPQAEGEITGLEQGRVALLENSEFKICNLSAGNIWVVWLHSTYVDEDGRFLSFDSAFNDYETWQVPAGGTTKFSLVRDDKVVWDGSTIFFSVLMRYGGKDIFRSGAWSAIGSDCYNLALDL